jgi:hypothetical protein
MLDAADKLPNLDQSTIISIKLTRAMLLSQSGNSSAARKLFDDALAGAVRFRFFGKQLEIRLAQLEAEKKRTGKTDEETLRELEKDARERGYLGISNKTIALRG